MKVTERRWIDPRALDVTWVAMALVALPHHERLPAWFWLLFGVSVLIARAVVSGRAVAPARWILTLPVIATVGALFHDFDSLLNPEGGVAFLLVAFCGKLLESRTSREQRVLHLLTLFIAPLQLLFDTSIGSALLCLAGGFFALAAMAMSQSRRDTPGTVLAFRLSGIALLQAIPVMVVLFVFFPRIAPLWNLPQPGGEPAVGFSDDLDLGRLGRLDDNPTIAFRVNFRGPDPQPTDLYWRMTVLDDLDGARWFWNKGRSSPVSAADPVRDLGYVVYPEPGVLGYVPHLDSLRAQPDRPLRVFDGSVLVMPDRQSRSPWSLYASGGVSSHVLSDDALQRLTRLPAAMAPRSRTLARRWQVELEGQPERLVAQFATWVEQQGFVYSLEPAEPEGDPTDAFMFSSREGYCSHYANALVVLLREAGVPARIVAGFQGGEFNAGGGYWIVRQSDAHAWVEYVGSDGIWKRVDPTTFVAPDRVRLGSRIHQRGIDLFGLEIGNPRHWALFSQFSKAMDYMNYQWITKVVSYDSQKQERLLDLLPDLAGLPGTGLWLIGGVTVALALVTLVALQPWRSPPKPPELRMLERLLERAAVLFRPRRAGETALAFSMALTEHYPESGRALGAFVAEYHQRAFAATLMVNGSEIASQTDKGEADRLKVLYRHCLRLMKKQIPRGSRAH